MISAFQANAYQIHATPSTVVGGAPYAVHLKQEQHMPEFTVTMTEQEWQILVDILSSAPVPLKMSFPLVQKLTGQIQQQRAAPKPVDAA